ncbi:MAG: TraX family protein [Eubacteriales bacterium]|nr:TraX family protein [Eubacteriales bacterium]
MRQSIEKCSGLSSAGLRNIAEISMLIDHTAQTLYMTYLRSSGIEDCYTDPLFSAMIFIGRLAFPIFAFLLAEGAHHSRDRMKYACRLAVLSLVSIIPFRLAFSSQGVPSSNVFFTLLAGLLTIMVTEKIRDQFNSHSEFLIRFLQAFAVICICTICLAINSDYDLFGVLLILIFYFLRENRSKMILCAALLFIPLYFLSVLLKFINTLDFFYSLSQYLQFCLRVVKHEAPGILALPLIALYNGNRGKALPKAFYYLFYPVHLILLVLIREAIF